MADGILLLHTFPLDATMWEPQISALSGETIVIAPNIPGSGGTPPCGEVTSMDEVADMAADAVKAAGIERVVVVGMGTGGHAALAFWRRHRSFVAGLVLVSTRADAETADTRISREDLAEWLRDHGLPILTANLPPLLSAGAPAALWDHVAAIIARQSGPGLASGLLGSARRVDSTPDLPTIDVPTLVIAATGDMICHPAIATRIASGIPGARLEVLRGPGQLSNLEVPDEFNRLLREHLARSN